MFEASLIKPEFNEKISRPNQNWKNIDCRLRVTFRGTGIEFVSGRNWCHAKCQKITNEEYANMQDVVSIATYCRNQQTWRRFEQMKLFKRCMDDIICSGRGYPEKYLKFSNSVHKNL